MKIDSSLNISQKFSIEVINGRYVNDSTEVRVVYCLSGEKNEFRLRGKRNEFACGNNVYRIIKRNGGLRITPWLIAKKDSCVHFKPSDFLKITELNCFVNNIEKKQKFYLYNFKYLPDGAESVKLYVKRYRLIKEVFETKTYIPFNSYISVQKQLIYSNVY